MSIESLIDPPFFPELEKPINSGSKARVRTLIFGMLFGFGGVASVFSLLAGDTEAATLISAGLFLPVGALLMFLGFRAAKNVDILKARLEAETHQYYNSERARLQELQGKMSTSEWENYKLQLQNQKLLVELNRKQNVKTRTTTTTTSWVTEVGD